MKGKSGKAMSKECCGVIYSDEDEVCKICGKPLTYETKDEAETESNETDKTNVEKKTEDVQDEKESISIDTPVEEKENISAADSEEDDDEENETEDENSDKASVGHIIFGIVSILLAVAGIALIGLGVYYLIISPSYANKGSGGSELVFSEISTETDASSTGIRGLLSYAEIATDSDAYIDDSPVSTDTDANSNDDEVVE